MNIWEELIKDLYKDPEVQEFFAASIRFAMSTDTPCEDGHDG
jgi:pantoate kinase